jgi:hypothetical protein
VIDGPRVLPPRIDEVNEEGIPVCAPLKMADCYRFHSFRRPRLKLSEANAPCTVRPSSVNLRIVFFMAPITRSAVLFDLICNEDAFRL